MSAREGFGLGAPIMLHYGSQQQADNMLPHTYRPGLSQAWGMPEHRTATAEHAPPRPFIHPAAFQAPLSPPAFSQELPPHQLPFPAQGPSGAVRPYSALSHFQNHQQACMEDFQRFLKPDNPTVGAGAPILASALQGPSAVQMDRILPPEVFLEQEIPGAGTGVSVIPPILQGAPAVQQGRILPPEVFLKVLQSPTKADSPPALARPVARTAPVPLAGLYAKSVTTEATWTKRRRTPRVYHPRCAPSRNGLGDPEGLGAAQPLHSLSTSAHTAERAAGDDPGASAHAAGVTTVGALCPDVHAAGTAIEGDEELAAQSQLDATDRTTHAAWSRQLGSSAQHDAAGKTASKEASAAPFHDQRSTAMEAGSPRSQLRSSLLMRVQTLDCAQSKDASASALEEVGMTPNGTAEEQLSHSSKPVSAVPEQADRAPRQGQEELACRNGAAGGSLQEIGETAVHSAAGAPQPEAAPQTAQAAATGSLTAGEGEAAEHPAVAKMSHTTAGQAADAACCCESAGDPAPAEEAAGRLPAQQSTAEPYSPSDSNCDWEAHACSEPDQADDDVAHDEDAVGGGGIVIQVNQCNMRQVPFESILELAAMAPSGWQERYGRTLSAPLPTTAGQPGSPAGSIRKRAKSQPAQRRRPGQGMNASTSELEGAAVEESSASLASEQASLTYPAPMLGSTEIEVSSAAHALDVAGPEAARAAHIPERETEEEQLPAPGASEQASLESPAALLEGTRAGEPSATHASKPDSPAQHTQKPLPRELAMLQADGLAEPARLAALSHDGRPVTRHKVSALTEREQRALLRRKDPTAAAAQALSSARRRSTSAARPSRAAHAGAPASPVRLWSNSAARQSRGANAQPLASSVRDAAGRFLSPQKLQRRGKLLRQRSPAGRHVSARVASSRVQTLPKSTAARRSFRSSEDASSPGSKAPARSSAGETYVMNATERMLEIPPEMPLQAPYSLVPPPIKVLSPASPAGPKGAAACKEDTARCQHKRAPGTEPCTEEAVAASGLAATLLGAGLPGPGHAGSAPCDELVSCVPARLKRVPGGDPLQNKQVARLCELIRTNSREFQAGGRVLRLKQYVSSDVRPPHIDAILDALSDNTRVEVLYIQNFEWGMLDAQLEHLARVLTNKRIWALNVGENFQISIDGWTRFTKALEQTAVGYMYVSEHHLKHTDLKIRMRDVIRINRKAGQQRDPEVISKVGNMWFNPKLPDAKPRRAKSGPSSPARPLAQGAAGARHGAAENLRLAQQQSRKKALEKHAQWLPPKHAVREIQGFTHVSVPKEPQEKEAARRGSPYAKVACPQPERHSEKFAKLAGRPKDFKGPLECTWCHATETACWRRHHRTRALLCNACGVRANNPNNARFGARVMGVRKKPAPKKCDPIGPRASSDERKAAQALRLPRAQAKQAGTGPPQPASAQCSVKVQSLPTGSGPSELAPAQQSPTQEPLKEPAQKWPTGRRSALRTAPTSAFRPVQPGAAQPASIQEPLHASSVPSSGLPAKRPPDAGFPEAPPKKVQFACEECGEPVTRNSSSGEDIDSEAILCRACDPSNRVLSPQQVQSIRAEIDNAVRTLSQATQLQDSPWQQSLMAGQQGMHSAVPEEAWAAAGQPAAPGSAFADWRAGLENITLLTGGTQNAGALQVSSDQRVLQEPVPHAAGIAELADAACHIAATAADSSMLGAPFASPPRQPLDGSADGLPEVDSAAVGLETDTLPDTQQGHTPPATQGKCGLDSPDAGMGPSPKRLCAGSPQAGSRVRMKQRELVPVQHLLAAKYPLLGRTAQSSSLSEDEQLLTLLCWTRKPQPSAGQTWAPSIRSKAGQDPEQEPAACMG